MGFKISWLAFHGMGKADVLDAMALVDSGESDEANEAPFSGAELPDDWYIIFSNDFDYVSPNLLADVSKRCRVVACQVHEGVMFQAAYGYARGAPEWTVFHDAQAGMYDLSIQALRQITTPRSRPASRRSKKTRVVSARTSTSSPTYRSKWRALSAAIGTICGRIGVNRNSRDWSLDNGIPHQLARVRDGRRRYAPNALRAAAISSNVVTHDVTSRYASAPSGADG